MCIRWASIAPGELRATKIIKGSQATYGGGNLLLTVPEKEHLNGISSLASSWIRNYVGSDEFINGSQRYCLRVPDADLERAQDAKGGLGNPKPP
ncbi:type IIL restriction-modification enzyme MmeI [Gleimia europaea]|uniref:MmeI-like target recognition domain-containing protein n=1 Tax=Gleimia europaea ACS-120-V-Col10b TaxID=883069 RepID=A0A9W5RD22_9ACTO|nr:hypothetical protein HMPREF9238_01521 [Gleimia europaea ACS-120-V-Col10b]